jgi:FkbM family methyltransferase
MVGDYPRSPVRLRRGLRPHTRTEERMRTIRTVLRAIVRRFGYDFHRLEDERDPFNDMRSLSHGRPTIFDIGANVGQTIQQFRRTIPDCRIHAFEPSPTTYAKLREACGGLTDLWINNVAVGSQVGTVEFIESMDCEKSSVLEPHGVSWGGVKQRISVPITTVDEYCKERDMMHIDILKCDTQGYDLRVLKGAAGLFDRDAIKLVFLEINFAELYHKQDSLEELFGFLRMRGFALVTIYRVNYNEDGLAGWADALFVNRRHGGSVLQPRTCLKIKSPTLRTPDQFTNDHSSRRSTHR